MGARAKSPRRPAAFANRRAAGAPRSSRSTRSEQRRVTVLCMPISLWQKQASAAWLATNEPVLAYLAGENLAIILRAGRSRSIVQIACSRRSEAMQLVRRFGGDFETLPRNWQPVAVEDHPPIRIGRRLEIASAPTQRDHSQRSQLVIPAAGAFGTGEHATTALSLRLLEETTRSLSPGWDLLDVGTGTGILALAARCLGAGEVLGLDSDPRALAHARQNARLNQISRARFLARDVLLWKPTARYDVVMANLFSELLIAALPIFRRALRRTGRLIVSGILREQAESVVRALHQAGFHLEKQRRRGKWVAVLAGRFAR
jgi:ribosomal protein L11 methyltransferase